MNVKQRVYQVDLARGFACLSMPIHHTVYNLYTTGIVAEQLTKNWFWVMYQKLGLGTFVFVSGMAFILSTQKLQLSIGNTINDCENTDTKSECL